MIPPLFRHMSYLKTMLTIWQKHEGKETSKNPIFKHFSKLGKIRKCSVGFLKIPIHHFYKLEKAWKYTQPRVNLHKKGSSHFKLNINDWDIPFPKSLRIYQWIRKNIFHWGKWNEPIGNSAHTTECLVKRPWRYIFLADVYKSTALVNGLKRLKH